MRRDTCDIPVCRMQGQEEGEGRENTVQRGELQGQGGQEAQGQEGQDAPQELQRLSQVAQHKQVVTPSAGQGWLAHAYPGSVINKAGVHLKRKF